MADRVVIRCRDDGPFVVVGPAEVVDAEGQRFAIPPGKSNIALCRCGSSKQKPFCDGSHRQIGFHASERANEVTSDE